MTWILSETETRALREAHDAPTEPTLFRKDDLIAMVYCTPNDGLWHLLLAVKHNVRLPDLYELLEAQRSLLPGIDNFTVSAANVMEHEREWHPPVPVFHLAELPTDKGKLQ